MLYYLQDLAIYPFYSSCKYIKLVSLFVFCLYHLSLLMSPLTDLFQILIGQTTGMFLAWFQNSKFNCFLFFLERRERTISLNRFKLLVTSKGTTLILGTPSSGNSGIVDIEVNLLLICRLIQSLFEIPRLVREIKHCVDCGYRDQVIGSMSIQYKSYELRTSRKD